MMRLAAMVLAGVVCVCCMVVLVGLVDWVGWVGWDRLVCWQAVFMRLAGLKWLVSRMDTGCWHFGVINEDNGTDEVC